MRSIFEDFERELVDSARQQAGADPQASRLTRRFAGATRTARAIPAAMVVALCLGVFVIAVTSLHAGDHRSRTSEGVVGVSTSAPASAPTTTTPGTLFRPAPGNTIQLPVLRGAKARTRSLANYRGHLVLLNFFASWCQPCRAESPTLEAAQKLLAAHHGTVLGVSFENSRSGALGFLRGHHLTYPALDETQPPDRLADNLGSAFGLDGVPDSFLINRQGSVVWESLYELTPAFARTVLPRLIAEFGGPVPSCASAGTSTRASGGCSHG